MSTVLLLSTADTDLLAARASDAAYRIGNPTRVDVGEELPGLVDGADLAVVRLLGGKRAWEDGLAALRSAGIPTVLLGGESVPDAELMAESSVPAGVVAEALRYLVEGGPDNLTQLARFLSDTVLLTGEGFDEPRKMPEYGVHGSRDAVAGRPTVGVLFYRAHQLSGNTAFVDTLCDAIEARGANALPVYCGSLRGADPGLYELLGRADALVATVLAAGARTPRRPRRAVTRRPGTSARWPTWTCRCCKDSASPPPGPPGRPPTPPCPPWTRRCRWRSRSSTAGWSRCRSPSRSRVRTRCRSTSPTPSGPRASPESPSGTRRSGTSRTPGRSSRWSSRRTRPSTPGSATRSVSTPRRRPCGCWTRSGTRGTGSPTTPPRATS